MDITKIRVDVLAALRTLGFEDRDIGQFSVKEAFGKYCKYNGLSDWGDILIGALDNLQQASHSFHRYEILESNKETAVYHGGQEVAVFRATEDDPNGARSAHHYVASLAGAVVSTPELPSIDIARAIIAQRSVLLQGADWDIVADTAYCDANLCEQIIAAEGEVRELASVANKALLVIGHVIDGMIPCGEVNEEQCEIAGDSLAALHYLHESASYFGAEPTALPYLPMELSVNGPEFLASLDLEKVFGSGVEMGELSCDNPLQIADGAVLYRVNGRGLDHEINRPDMGHLIVNNRNVMTINLEHGFEHAVVRSGPVSEFLKAVYAPSPRG